MTTAIRPNRPTALPRRSPSASDDPVFAPIEFHTAEAGVLATTVRVADWQPVDFEVYESFASTARHIPAPVIDAALKRSTTTVAYWFDERTDAHQLAYEIAAGGVR